MKTILVSTEVILLGVSAGALIPAIAALPAIGYPMGKLNFIISAIASLFWLSLWGVTRYIRKQL